MTYSPENINSTKTAIQKYTNAAKHKRKNDKLIRKRFSKFIAQEKDFGDDVWSVIKSFIVTDFYIDADWLPSPNTKILAPNDWDRCYYTIEIGKRVSWNFAWARCVWQDNSEVKEPFKLHQIYRSITKHPDKNKLIMSEEIEQRWFFDYETDRDNYPYHRNYWTQHQFNAEQNRDTNDEVARLKKAIDDDEPFIDLCDLRWLSLMGVKY